MFGLNAIDVCIPIDAPSEYTNFLELCAIVLFDTKTKFIPYSVLGRTYIERGYKFKEHNKYDFLGYKIWLHLFLDTCGSHIFIYYPTFANEGDDIKIIISCWWQESYISWTHGEYGLFADIYELLSYDLASKTLPWFNFKK